jgi:ribosome biogenesis GTPase / thiamine phosphate phosphatase
VSDRPARAAKASTLSSTAVPGLVVSAHGRHVVVEGDHGERVRCHTRGKKSELVVGDRVRWAASGDEGIVTSLDERRNRLHRQDEWRTKVFAANVDQVVLLVAVEPPFADAQLLRSIVAAADAGLHTTIVCNKIDLPGAEPTLARLEAYRSAEVDLIALALKPRASTSQRADARALLEPMLRDKITLVIGPSGVGKSTLVNLLVPDAQAQVGELSLALNAGRHTTTASRWYWLDATRRGALIDTPGFQQFGLHHIELERIAALLSDIREHTGSCRFYNCTHRHEPGCGVTRAVAEGRLAGTKHRGYLDLMAQLDSERAAFAG